MESYISGKSWAAALPASPDGSTLDSYRLFTTDSAARDWLRTFGWAYDANWRDALCITEFCCLGAPWFGVISSSAAVSMHDWGSHALFFGAECGGFAAAWSFSSMGMKPDFRSKRETLFSSFLHGIPLWPQVIFTRCPCGKATKSSLVSGMFSISFWIVSSSSKQDF